MKYYITFNPDMGYIGIKSDLSYQETIDWMHRELDLYSDLYLSNKERYMTFIDKSCQFKAGTIIE